MSEQLQAPPPDPEQEQLAEIALAPTPSDPWSVWFFRAVQVIGVAMVVYQQVLQKSDPWLLLVATAMMLGGLGLQLIARKLPSLMGGP